MSIEKIRIRVAERQLTRAHQGLLAATQYAKSLSRSQRTVNSTQPTSPVEFRYMGPFGHG